MPKSKAEWKRLAMPKKKAKYKDPPRYEFILEYENEFKKRFEETLKNTKEALERELNQQMDVS